MLPLKQAHYVPIESVDDDSEDGTPPDAQSWKTSSCLNSQFGRVPSLVWVFHSLVILSACVVVLINTYSTSLLRQQLLKKQDWCA